MRSELGRVVALLESVPTGRELVRRAAARWGAGRAGEERLGELVAWGRVSRTDSVLTRHYDPGTGEENREREITIILKRDQPQAERVLDLAHELAHAVEQETWDPYDPELTPGRYLRLSIEGKGGEVEAVALECRVAHELSRYRGVKSARCDRYPMERGNRIDRRRILRDFYRVGRWERTVREILGDEAGRFPDLTGREPLLYSSTGRAPYPLSLLREFEELNEAACENSRRRMAAERAPAGARENRTMRFLDRRCRGVAAERRDAGPGSTRG